MKLTIVFLLLGTSMLLAESSYAQRTMINLDLKDATLENVFEAIRGQSEFELGMAVY